MFDGLSVRYPFTDEPMKDRPSRVLNLDVVLEVEGFEYVVGEIDRQMGGVCVEDLIGSVAVSLPIGKTMSAYFSLSIFASLYDVPSAGVASRL